MKNIENKTEITEDEFNKIIVDKINSSKSEVEGYETFSLFVDKEDYKSRDMRLKYYKAGNDVFFELDGSVVKP